MDELAFLDATAQADLVHRGDVQPVELVDAAIDRIERLDPKLNAVIHRRFDQARAEAAQVDRAAPFAGVPFLVKDAVCETAGDPYHLGMRFLKERGHRSDHDTWLAQRYRRAGFVFVGKTNLPELALMATTEPVAYGPSRNPWDLERSTGGSSGGAGAAVASGMVPAAHGNDMGGSIRVPASFCGLVGLKPTRGRTTIGPDFGEYWGQMTHEHVLTRSVRDTAAILDACAGPGPGDPYTAVPPTRPWRDEVGADPGRLRVALRTTQPSGAPVDPECATAVERTAAALAELGHEVREVEVPGLDADVMTPYGVMLSVHIASELDRIGALVGTPITGDDVEPATWAFAEQGRQVTGTQLVEATHAMQGWARGVATVWSDVDLVVTPQSAVLPPELGRMGTDFDVLFGVVAFTIPFNVTGDPAMSLPLHWSAAGLPVGVQLVAPQGREDVLVRVGAQLEQALPWADRLPPVHA
jgi:amidase